MPLDNSLGDPAEQAAVTLQGGPGMDPVSQAIAVLHSLGMGQQDPVQAAADEAAAGGVPVLTTGSPAGPTPIVPPPEVGPDLASPVSEHTMIAGPNPDRPDVPVPAEAMSPAYASDIQDERNPADPYSGAPTEPLGALEQAAADEEAQLRRRDMATKSAIDWELAAQKDEADAKAKIYEDSATASQLNFEAKQKRDAALNAHHDAENAANLTQLMDMVKKEPNPGRYWENMSNFGKAMWALSMFSDAMRVNFGAPGAQAVTLEMYKQAVAADVAAQRARLDSEVAVKKLQMVGTKEKQTRNLSDSFDKYSQEILRLKSLEAGALVRVTSPNDLDAEAKKAAQLAQTQQDTLDLIQKRSDHTRKASLQDSAQRFDAGQASIKRKFERDERIAGQEFQIQRDNNTAMNKLMNSPMSLSVGQARTAGQMPSDEHGPLYRVAQSGTGGTSGLIVVDPVTKQPVFGNGEAWFHKDDKEGQKQFANINQYASKEYKLVKEAKEILASENGYKTLVAGNMNPRLQTIMSELGTMAAKRQGPGPYSEKDFSRGLQARIGFDPNASGLERFKHVVSKDAIQTNMQTMLDEMEGMVNVEATSLLDKTLNGPAEVIWHPFDLEAKKAKEPSEYERAGEAPKPVKPLAGVSDYDKRRQAEAGDPNRAGRELAPHDTAVIDSLKKMAEGSSPELIRKKAAQIIDSLTEVTDPWDTRRGTVADPVTGIRRPASSEDKNTLEYATKVAEGLASKAKREVDSAEFLLSKRKTPPTKDTIRSLLKDMGQYRNEADVERLFEKFKGK